MGSYGREVEFGVSAEPLASPPDWVARVAKAADKAGLELLGIQHHPHQRRFLDTWTLISTLIPATERTRFFPDVANLPLRPPAALAKAAASLDVLSGGRIEIGPGAEVPSGTLSWRWCPRRSEGGARRATEEAIEVMRLVWSGERSLRFEGEFYLLKGMRPGPRPVHDIGICVGAYGPRMLSLMGRLADGWVPSLGHVSSEKVPEMQKRIDGAAGEAGRSPKEIRRVYNIWGRMGERGDGLLDGPRSLWVEQLSTFALEQAMDTFVCWPSEDHVHQIELFASEIVPTIREDVEAKYSST